MTAPFLFFPLPLQKMLFLCTETDFGRMKRIFWGEFISHYSFYSDVHCVGSCFKCLSLVLSSFASAVSGRKFIGRMWPKLLGKTKCVCRCATQSLSDIKLIRIEEAMQQRQKIPSSTPSSMLLLDTAINQHFVYIESSQKLTINQCSTRKRNGNRSKQ